MKDGRDLQGRVEDKSIPLLLLAKAIKQISYSNQVMGMLWSSRGKAIHLNTKTHQLLVKYLVIENEIEQQEV